MKRTRFQLIGVICGCLVFLSACDPSETPTSALNDDVEEVMAPRAGDIIPGQYIVVLKDRSEFSGKTVRQVLDEMTSAEGVETFHIYEHALRGFAGLFSDAAIERVRNNPFVDYIEQDRVVTLPITIEGNKGKKPPKDGGGGDNPPAEELPWGITRVGGALNSDGTACVIDTGIDLDHPDLNVDTDRSRSFLTGRQSNNPDDQHGHGTHVAGTIAAKSGGGYVVGVAAGAAVVSVRVLDRRGSGTVSGVVGGVDYVATEKAGCDVANMSLGGGISTTLDNAVIAAAASGVTFALAAGNESDDANNHSPARVNGPNIYTVSAIDTNDVFAWFSNYGSSVDYAAPGVSILSLWKNGGTNTISGTSMAAPHVAGILLLGNIVTDGYANGDQDGNPDPTASH